MRRPRKKSLEEVFPQGFHYTKDEFFNRPQQVASIFCALDLIQSSNFLRKEVIQPQVPLRLPCYDLVPITEFIFGA